MSYRRRLEGDLDRWIGAGLVPAENRAAILADTAAGRRIGAAAALAIIGGLLLGAAVIAFVAANWNGIPRLARFGLILALFLATTGAAAKASTGGVSTSRPMLANVLLATAGLIYAAAIGLTGQIFDLTGDPQTALRGAGVAAALLALAGRSSAAAIVSLLLLTLGEFAGGLRDDQTRWLVVAAALGGWLAWRWTSVPLAHAASLAAILGAFFLATLGKDLAWMLAVAAVLAALAGAARLADLRLSTIAFVWFAAAALLFYGVGGLQAEAGWLILHRGGWVVLSGAAIALGLHDRQSAVTAAGIAAMTAAACLILADLGMGLMAAAALFAVCAAMALAAGALLQRRRRA